MKTSFQLWRESNKGTLNRKVRSGRPRACTMKEDHTLKIAVVKDNFCWPQKTIFPHNQNPISFTILNFVNQKKKFSVLNFCCAQQAFSSSLQNSQFNPVVVLYCGSSGSTRTNVFKSNVHLITNLCLILFAAERDFFNISFFKIPLVSYVFLSFSCNSIF